MNLNVGRIVLCAGLLLCVASLGSASVTRVYALAALDSKVGGAPNSKCFKSNCSCQADCALVGDLCVRCEAVPPTEVLYECCVDGLSTDFCDTVTGNPQQCGRKTTSAPHQGRCYVNNQPLCPTPQSSDPICDQKPGLDPSSNACTTP
jgi:hypothetical protein